MEWKGTIRDHTGSPRLRELIGISWLISRTGTPGLFPTPAPRPVRPDREEPSLYQLLGSSSSGALMSPSNVQSISKDIS